MTNTKQTATNIIDEVLTLAEAKCFGANATPIDRLHKGVNAELNFYAQLIRERKEMLAALDTAAFLIAERDAELNDIKATVKANGVAAMTLGEKRK